MPLVKSGDYLFPSLLVPLLVSKPLDETITNNASLQDDDHLALAVEANAGYDLRLRAFINGNANPDMKIGWSAPAGATMVWGIVDVQAGTTAGKVAISDVVPIPTTGANQLLMAEGTLFTGASAGTLRFRWAQNGANASATTVQAGSVLRLDRVA